MVCDHPGRVGLVVAVEGCAMWGVGRVAVGVGVHVVGTVQLGLLWMVLEASILFAAAAAAAAAAVDDVVGRGHSEDFAGGDAQLGVCWFAGPYLAVH